MYYRYLPRSGLNKLYRHHRYSQGAAWLPEPRHSSPKVEVNIYLHEDFIRLNQTQKHLKKIRFLATSSELSCPSSIEDLVLKRRFFLRQKEYSLFYNVPGVHLRPQPLRYNPAVDVSAVMKEAGAAILQLYIEPASSHISTLPFAPMYLKEMDDPSLCDSYMMISFYSFSAILRPSSAAVLLKELWSPFRALGRVYVAREGINAQMAVPTNVFGRFQQSFRHLPYLSDLRLNVDQEVTRADFEAFLPFRSLHIRQKERLVADGGIDLNLDAESIGVELSPKQWHDKLDQQGTIVIDCRNKFESDVGRFQHATPLDTTVFKESWEALEKLLEGKPRDAHVMTYCTGGIRCVKTNAFIVQKLGFKNVSRLQGGIINYVKSIQTAGEVHDWEGSAAPISESDRRIPPKVLIASKFIGVNYVFDERVCSRVTDDVLTACKGCGKPWDMYTNCNNTGCCTRTLLCDDCFSARRGCCSKSCESTYEDFLRQCSTAPVTLFKGGPTTSKQLPQSGGSIATRNIITSDTTAKAKRPPKMSFQMWRRTKANSYRVTHATKPPLRNFSTATPSGLEWDPSVTSEIVQYCESISSEETAQLREVRSITEREYPNAYKMSCGPYLGRVLSTISRMTRPSRILEVGTFTGYSALCLAEGLQPGGTLLTLERDPRAATIAQRCFQSSTHADRKIELMQGNAEDSLRKLINGNVALFDLVFMDADKNNYQSYCELILGGDRPMLKEGGVIIIDNVLWKGAVLHQQMGDQVALKSAREMSPKVLKQIEKGRNIHLFNEYIRDHPKLTSLMLPIRDGVTVAQFKM